MPRREFADVARDLKPIYTAIDSDAAHHELERFDEKWGERFPVITQAWLDSWEYVTPFLAFPPEVRRVIYTTNAIEALNRQLRKAVKTKGHFPTEDAARKLLYLAIQNAVRHGREPGTGRPRCWRSRFTSETAYPTNPKPAYTDNSDTLPPRDRLPAPHVGKRMVWVAGSRSRVSDAFSGGGGGACSESDEDREVQMVGGSSTGEEGQRQGVRTGLCGCGPGWGGRDA